MFTFVYSIGITNNNMKITLIILSIFFLTVGVYVNANNLPWLVNDVALGLGLLFIASEPN